MFSRILRFTYAISEDIIPRGKVPVVDPKRIARKDGAKRSAAGGSVASVRQTVGITIGEHSVFEIGGFGLQQYAKIRF